MRAQTPIQFRHQRKDPIQPNVKSFTGGTPCGVVKGLSTSFSPKGATEALLRTRKAGLRLRFATQRPVEVSVEVQRIQDSQVSLRPDEAVLELGNTLIDLLN